MQIDEEGGEMEVLVVRISKGLP